MRMRDEGAETEHGCMWVSAEDEEASVVMAGGDTVVVVCRKSFESGANVGRGL